MAIMAKDVVGPVLQDEEIKTCIATSLDLLNSMTDREDYTLEQYCHGGNYRANCNEMD